jgi:hypothetical protein
MSVTPRFELSSYWRAVPTRSNSDAKLRGNEMNLGGKDAIELQPYYTGAFPKNVLYSTCIDNTCLPLCRSK